ncbi:hypothetical protein FH5T_15910 [Draconibacterium orientale]|uniref:Uncharacterized protein n=1 Tax=Draconibacterium orientale TaxID=1168034 RepID=A0ABM5QEU3_9BACT|nr:hypothetical protein FH5T_15910 [Draconibacterium orientale]
MSEPVREKSRGTGEIPQYLLKLLCGKAKGKCWNAGKYCEWGWRDWNMTSDFCFGVESGWPKIRAGERKLREGMEQSEPEFRLLLCGAMRLFIPGYHQESENLRIMSKAGSAHRNNGPMHRN